MGIDPYEGVWKYPQVGLWHIRPEYQRCDELNCTLRFEMADFFDTLEQAECDALRLFQLIQF